MVRRQFPQDYFGEELQDDKTWIIVGIIVVGIVACVACVAMVMRK
jgi:hypothetical protein